MIKINAKELVLTRARKGLTVNELSITSGVSRNTIARIENNKSNATPVIIGKIAKALNVPIESIID